MRTAEECWEKVVKYSERVLDERFSRGERALWDHLADSWRACAQRVELLEQQRERGAAAVAQSPGLLLPRAANPFEQPEKAPLRPPAGRGTAVP